MANALTFNRRQTLAMSVSWLAAGGVLAGCSPQAPTFKSTDITGAAFAQDLKLTDHTGQVRTMADFRGKAVVVFFGFTQCPDVCPATLSTVAAAMRRMSPDVADQVRPVLITVDPKNDNAKVLANYVAGFDPRIHGLTGEPGLLQKIADSYGAVLGGQKATDHTALLYLVSPSGEVLRTFLPGAPPQEIAVAVERAIRG